MNAVPAKVAGVPRIVMVVPTPDGVLNPLVLAAAQARRRRRDLPHRRRAGRRRAGLRHRDHRARSPRSSAPATPMSPPPSGRCSARVGIDMIAGPSEVLVIADRHNNPDWIAADLLAQAEHDAAAQSILITDDAALGRRGRSRRRAPARRRCRAPRSPARAGAISAPSSWSRDFDEALPLADRIAAEHLEIATDDPEALAARIRNAGAIFLGRHTPEAIGDYVGGSNHVLPTARSARFSSGPRRARLHEAHLAPAAATPRRCAALGPAAITLARAEGLDAHAPLGRDPPQSGLERMSRACRAIRARRLIAVTLDEDSIGRSNAGRRARARGRDLRPARGQLVRADRPAPAAPTRCTCRSVDNRLVFDIRRDDRRAAGHASSCR